MFELTGKYTSAKVMIEPIEESCVAQISSFLNHPAFTNQIAIMPDAHAGKGSCIGFTMPLTDKIIPNVVGVDIGCGMFAMNIGKSLPLSIEELDHKIKQQIPFGMETHEISVFHMKNDFPWREANSSAQRFAQAYQSKFGYSLEIPRFDMPWFEDKCKDLKDANVRRMIGSIGTLGGGNHFIETGFSENSGYWITVHSGSRNFGKRICENWQDKAINKFHMENKETLKQKIKEAKNTYQGVELQKTIDELRATYKVPFAEPLLWLEGLEAGKYFFDMVFAQVYAQTNRMVMGNIIKNILKCDFVETIETVHNFIDFRDFIIRKGAIRSYTGEKMVIPFNSKVGLLICQGKSNPEWNYSAPHGAGRIMSRSQAKKRITVDSYTKQMEGVYSTCINNSTIDEAPEAYKDPAVIEEAIKDSVEILDRVKPIHNMKAGED